MTYNIFQTSETLFKVDGGAGGFRRVRPDLFRFRTVQRESPRRQRDMIAQWCWGAKLPIGYRASLESTSGVSGEGSMAGTAGSVSSCGSQTGCARRSA